LVHKADNMSDVTSNIPTEATEDSSTEVKTFFDKYFVNQISFPASQVDAVVGFFLKRGFGEEAARSTGIVLMNQAKVDNINVFKLLDSLKGLNDVQLSTIVSQVLNSYREKTSILGFKFTSDNDALESRNIKP
jgi:hypothetical protein